MTFQYFTVSFVNKTAFLSNSAETGTAHRPRRNSANTIPRKTTHLLTPVCRGWNLLFGNSCSPERSKKKEDNHPGPDERQTVPLEQAGQTIAQRHPGMWTPRISQTTVAKRQVFVNFYILLWCLMQQDKRGNSPQSWEEAGWANDPAASFWHHLGTTNLTKHPAAMATNKRILKATRPVWNLCQLEWTTLAQQPLGDIWTTYAATTFV